MIAEFHTFLSPRNPLGAARQDYELAQQHFEDVCRRSCCLNPEHQRRFLDALERQAQARDRYIAALSVK